MSVLLDRPRLMLSLALMLSGAGLVAWFHMPREEDPRLAERFGIIIAPYPGAEPGSVEERVVKPIEDELSEVEAIDHVDVTIRTGIAVFRIALRGDVGGDQTDRAWDEVEDALTAARREMPESALEPILDERQVETESVVVALTGGTDRVALAESADALEDRLLALADVSRVVISGDPGERITVDYDDATARRVGLDPLSLANVLQSHNSTTPGGSLRVGAREVPVRPLGELETVEAIEELPVPTRSGAVRLGDIANVRRTVNEPASVRVRHNGDEAVIVGAVSREGLKAEDFGAAVREVVDDFAEANPELGVTYVAFQPERVAARLGELGGSLLLGVGIVAGVLLLFMGFRMGLVVASVVPLVTLAGLAVYAGTGGVLHQMAVAALVLALGLLVDNAIVVAETIQRRLDAGASGNEAVQATLRELAIPLAAATGTTLASFLPMLLAEGTVGDFTRAIPVVTILTLIVSYAYALVVTPALAKFGLRPGKAATSRLDEFGAMVGGFGARHPGRTLAAALLIVGVCGAFATQVRINFFPSSDRNQVVVEVELPEGTHLDQTDDASRRLEGMLASLPEVTGVTTFVGRNVPKFYYNLPVRPASPHLAQLIVTTRDASSVAD
ncbi:MAG: efflux RND transporter permease subunit, partial [Myxococcota bacterium]